jgi:dCMP deaminase
MLTPRDGKFLRMCLANAPIFSTCSRRQYFAVVTGPEGRLVGTGYNGAPPNMTHCIDGGCPRAQAEGVVPGVAYGNCVAVHAEANAIIWSDRTARKAGTLYVNGPPCWDCGKLIAGSGLARVVFTYDPEYVYPELKKVEGLMTSAGLDVERLDQSVLVR